MFKWYKNYEKNTYPGIQVYGPIIVDAYKVPGIWYLSGWKMLNTYTPTGGNNIGMIVENNGNAV